VEEFEGGSKAHVKTATGRKVACQAVVVATNTPVNDRVVIHTKQAPYRTYVVGLEVPPGSVEKALFWDTADPYHYVRTQAQESGRPDLLIVGGEDHRTGQADDVEERWRRLERWTRERFPKAQAMTYKWSGQVLEPADGLAFIGRNPLDKDNVFIATGDSGQGMTHGTIAGILIGDLVQGRTNPWAHLYDPARRSIRAMKDFATELATTQKGYVPWVTPAEVSSVEEIPVGEGRILREGLHKIAAYRDSMGGVIRLSATCTHLGCIVEWNGGEKSWDCPCHGSRYAPDGHVLNGPAITGLARKD
jgi:Rieske Fe-S protein